MYTIIKPRSKIMRRYDRTKFVVVTFLVSIIAFGCAGSVTGIQNGRLMPCPSSPNCVSSYETDASHQTEALRYTGTREKAISAVISILEAMPEASIIKSDVDYVHAEFRSRIFKFVDDVEFQFVEASPVIHVRSASRVGYSDLGVNKKRMEQIRVLFQQKMEAGPGKND
jgi:uncharacterized protein (DUF1499 family)